MPPMNKLEKNSKGRPCTFSREELINTVTEMFWEEGYKSLSLNKVAQKMGLSRTSLYNSFKTKEDLFLECFNHYILNSPTQKLRQHQPGQAVGELLYTVLYEICEKRAQDPKNRGCLVANIYQELLNDETPLGQKLMEKSDTRKENMIQIIECAVQQKELPQETNTKITAFIILSFMTGLNAHAKSGATEKEMKEMCRIFLKNTGFKH